MAPAPEHIERLATLESEMRDVRSILAKREDYQSGVLERLTEIKFKQDQFLDYQKTCDASREAHANRIRALEDKWKVLRGQVFVLAAAGSLLGWLLDLLLKAKS